MSRRLGFSDTHPKIEKRLIEGYREMAPAQKMRQVRGMNRMGVLLGLSDIRQRHPDADEAECKFRLASRWLDADLMRAVFDWDPAEKGY